MGMRQIDAIRLTTSCVFLKNCENRSFAQNFAANKGRA
jgi:hypothetical protein